MNKGFTLIEIIVVIGILSIIGVIVLTIFSRTLKGNNKAQILSSIKQNGQGALENIDKNIRNADNLVCSSPSNTTVVVKNGIYTRFRFIISDINNNGSIVTDNPTPQILDTTPQLFVNRVCNPTDPMNSATILTDTNPQTGVSLVSGSFSTSKLAGFKDAVTVSFVLASGVKAPSAISGEIDTVTFETTIQLR